MRRNLLACCLALLLPAALAVAQQDEQGAASRPATTKAAPTYNQSFYWWPAYRSMLPGLADEQADKLDGITASHGRLTGELYRLFREGKLTREQYSDGLRNLRDEIETARRRVLTPAQQQELDRLENVWRMKMDAFRGIPNPYYAVQFTEEQLARILSYRAEHYDPAVGKLDERSRTLAADYGRAATSAERIETIGRMGDLEHERGRVQEDFRQYVEGVLLPEQLPAVRPEMNPAASSVRLKIDMRDWLPLKAIRQIAESGSLKLEVEEAAGKILEKAEQTVTIQSSLVTPELAIEKVASAFGLRAVRRGDTVVLFAPQDSVSVVTTPEYGRGSVDVIPGAKNRLAKWRFPVRDILARYSQEQLVKYIRSVSKTATIEVDKETDTILVTMPENEVEAVKGAITALRQ